VAGAAAVVAGALALPPAANALRGTEPGPRPASGTALAPRAAPGTVLTTCASEIGMPLALGWRASSIQAGPCWFVNLRQATATYYGQRDVAISGLAVSVRNGVTASVSVVGPAVGHFRFLFRPRDFSQGVGGRYTMKSGENRVTFAGCTPESARPGESFSYPPGYTKFGGYYIVDKVPRRVSLEIRSSAARRAAAVPAGAWCGVGAGLAIPSRGGGEPVFVDRPRRLAPARQGPDGGGGCLRPARRGPGPDPDRRPRMRPFTRARGRRDVPMWTPSGCSQ
jgi:hypothetical protein